MIADMLFDKSEATICGVTPRDYQTEDLNRSFEQWDRGIRGTLTRMFTGAGKTLCTALKFRKWLDRGPGYKCMVISYEQHLVHQFAEEIQDTIGVEPHIEMASHEISPDYIPDIVVASRQSLARHKLATIEQRSALTELGVGELGVLTMRKAKTLLRHMRKGGSVEYAQRFIEEFHDSYKANLQMGAYSRLFKFDWNYNWLLAFDEAHKHAYKLATVKHLIDWFDQNPNSRRTGLTATPKRYDRVSIGDRMFPGIAIDYPLYSVNERCAVKQGFAVPYVQRFISVKGVDFKKLSRIAGDFDESELQKVLGDEKTLATLVEPMLDMCGERRTLIFSPGVAMARAVADYINARQKCKCSSCDFVAWYTKDNDNQCKSCGTSDFSVLSRGSEAFALWGEVPYGDRKRIYQGHQTGEFQFLSVCGLCKEGYNDCEISCVAVFRPVSEAASSLAEQMKGRSSRPLPKLIDGLETAQERLEAIKNSAKPNALIIDLVGITGLADCASTAGIYAEGMPDEVIERANEIALAGGCEVDVEEAIKQAQEEIETERERKRREREEALRKARELAERRSRAGVEVSYSVQERGNAPRKKHMATLATEKQISYIAFLGLDVSAIELSKKQAGRIIQQFMDGASVQDVKYTNGLGDECPPVFASAAQLKYLERNRISHEKTITKREASQLIEQSKNGTAPAAPKTNGNGWADGFSADAWWNKIQECKSHNDLTNVGKLLVIQKRAGQLPEKDYENLINAGRERRKTLEFMNS